MNVCTRSYPTDPALGSAPGWPIVLYFHHVNETVRHYTAIRSESFRRGLAILLETVGPALEPASVRHGVAPPDEPRFLITFDDGYRDNITTAAPILAEFGVRMLLFCVTDALDTASDADRQPREAMPPREDFLSWDEARDLSAAGHLISAHTRTHRRLIDLDHDQAFGEVTESLKAVRFRTGCRAETFAYPYGLVPRPSVLPEGVLGFGTVKSAPAPWEASPREIRRTYLPADEEETWQHLATGWRQQWFGYQ